MENKRESESVDSICAEMLCGGIEIPKHRNDHELLGGFGKRIKEANGKLKVAVLDFCNAFTMVYEPPFDDCPFILATAFTEFCEKLGIEQVRVDKPEAVAVAVSNRTEESPEASAKCREALKLCMSEMCDRCRVAAASQGDSSPCLNGCETLRMAKAALDGKFPTGEKSSIVGDVAKLREACDYARDMCADAIHFIDADSDRLMEYLKSVVVKMNSALAAPPRNCDVGTPREQEKRMDEWCHNGKRVCRCGDDGCPLYDRKTNCAFDWMQRKITDDENREGAKK